MVKIQLPVYRSNETILNMKENDQNNMTFFIMKISGYSYFANVTTVRASGKNKRPNFQVPIIGNDEQLFEHDK